MTPELERLIDAAVADGVVTDKEREVLHRKARELGVSPDELDILVDAKLTTSKRDAKPKKPNKCPSCGTPVSGLARVCEGCGHVLDEGGGGGAPDLHTAIERMENALAQLKANAGASSSEEDRRFAEAVAFAEKERRQIYAYFGDDQRIRKHLESFDAELERHKSKQKKNNIKTGAVVVSVLSLLLGGPVMLFMWTSHSKETAKETAQQKMANLVGEYKSGERTLALTPGGMSVSGVGPKESGQTFSVSWSEHGKLESKVDLFAFETDLGDCGLLCDYRCTGTIAKQGENLVVASAGDGKGYCARFAGTWARGRSSKATPIAVAAAAPTPAKELSEVVKTALANLPGKWLEVPKAGQPTGVRCIREINAEEWATDSGTITSNQYCGADGKPVNYSLGKVGRTSFELVLEPDPSEARALGANGNSLVFRVDGDTLVEQRDDDTDGRVMKKGGMK